MSINSTPALPSPLSSYDRPTAANFTLAPNPTLPQQASLGSGEASTVAIAPPNPFEPIVTPPAGQGVSMRVPAILPKLSDGVSPIILDFTANGGTWGSTQNAAVNFAQSWNTQSPQAALRDAPANIRQAIASDPGLYGSHPGQLSNPTLRALVVPLVYRDDNDRLGYANTVVLVPATQVPSYADSLRGISNPALPQGSVQIFGDRSIVTNSGINGFTLGILQQKEHQYYSQLPIDQQPSGTFAFNLPLVDPTGGTNAPPQMIRPNVPPGLQQTERGTPEQQVLAGLVEGLDGPNGANRRILQTLADANIPGLSAAAGHQLRMRDEMRAELMRALDNPAGGVVDMAATISYGGQSFTVGALLGIGGAATGGAVAGGATWGAIGGGALGVTAQGVLDGSITTPEQFGKALALNLLTDAAFTAGFSLLGDAVTVAQIPRALDDLDAGRPGRIGSYDLRRGEGGRLEVKLRNEAWQIPVEVEARPVPETPVTNAAPDTGDSAVAPPANATPDAPRSNTTPIPDPGAGVVPSPAPLPTRQELLQTEGAINALVNKDGPLTSEEYSDLLRLAVDYDANVATYNASSPSEPFSRDSDLISQVGSLLFAPTTTTSASPPSTNPNGLTSQRPPVEVNNVMPGEGAGPNLPDSALVQEGAEAGTTNRRDMAEYASLRARLPEVISEVREAANNARPVATLKAGQNVARLDYDLDGVTGSLNGASGGRVIQNFVPPVTAGEAVISPLYNNRAADTEYKLLNWLAQNLNDNLDGAQTSGRIVLYSEFSVCESCANVIREFKRMYPLIDVVVIAGPRPRPESLSDPLPSPAREATPQLPQTSSAAEAFPAQAAQIFSEADLAAISRRIDPDLLAMLNDPQGAIAGFTPDQSETMRRVLSEQMPRLQTPDDVARFITQMFVNPLSGLKNANALPLVAEPGHHLIVAEFGGGKSVNEALSHQHGDDLIAAGMAEITRVVEAAGGQVLHPNGATAIIVVPPGRVEETKQRLDEAFRDLAIGTADRGSPQVFRPGIAYLDTGPITDASVGGLEGQFARGRGGIDAVKAERVEQGLYPARGADVFQPYDPGVHSHVRLLEGTAQVPPTGARQDQNAVLRERFDGLSEQIEAMPPQDREKLARRAVQERFMHASGVLNGAGSLTAPRDADGRVLEGYVHAQGDLSKLSLINGFSWPAGDAAIAHLNAALEAAASAYPNVTFQKYGGDEWEAIGPRADVEAAVQSIRDYLAGAAIEFPNPENPAETLELRGLGVQIGTLDIPRDATTGRAPSEALEHKMSEDKLLRGYQLDIRSTVSDSQFFESQLDNLLDDPLEDPMGDLLNDLLSGDDQSSTFHFRDLAAGLGRNPVIVASAGGALPIGVSAGNFDATPRLGTANFTLAEFDPNSATSLPGRLSSGPLATGDIPPQAVLGVGLTPAQEVYSTAQLQAAEDLWKAVDEGALSFNSFAEAAQAIEQRSADVGRAAVMRFDPGLAADAVTRIVGHFSAELSRKAKLIHDGFAGIQNGVNVANNEAGAGNKAANALARIATNPAVFGNEGAQWASTVLGSYNVAQNVWNGINGFQDGGKTTLGVASGASLVLGSGLLGSDAVNAAGYINKGLQVDQAVKLINKGNPIAGYGLAASVVASLFDGPVARIAENLFSTVSSAALMTTNPLTALPGFALGALGLIQSVNQAFSPNWIEITNELDVSRDGVADKIKFELKDDDWSYTVRNGTTHLPISNLEFSVAQRTRDAAPGAITENSDASDWLNRTDGKDKVAGEYVLTLNPKFVLPDAAASTELGKIERASVTINQQQYDQLFGPGAPLAGKASGNLMAHLEPAQIEALRKHIPDQEVWFRQEKKNEGMTYSVDVDGDGALDSITTFPKIPGGVDGDSSSIIRLKTKEGEVYAEYARNKDGSNSVQSRAADALAAEGGDRVEFGSDPATRSTGVVKVHYEALARKMGPEEKLFGLAYAASHPQLAEHLMRDSGGVTNKTLDVLAAKAFWHMANEGSKHGYETTFDPMAYLAANPDVARAFSSPVPGEPDKTAYDLLAATQHYITDGMRQGLKTMPDQVGSADNGLWNTVEVFGGSPGEAPASGQPVAIGTSGEETLQGTEAEDLLLGQGGDDILFGGVASDTLHGGKGADALFGEKGHDILFGGQGNDFLFGGLGNDVGYGGKGDDVLLMGKDEDIGRGGKAADYVHGQQGADQVFGDKGDDEVLGGKGDDVVHGGKGNDNLAGGKGADTLSGDRGDDVIDGGEGFDTAGFSGSIDDYVITREGDGIRIVDKRADGSGSDLVTNVEAFQFAGATLSLDQIEARLA